MASKKESKLELASAMVRQVMPEFSAQRNVIILCDSWYVKQNLVSVVDEYENLDLIGNARADSVIYDLAPPERIQEQGDIWHPFASCPVQRRFFLPGTKYLQLCRKP